MLRDGETRRAAAPAARRLRANSAKAALVSMAGRRGYTGSNTLSELQDASRRNR